MFCEIRLVDEKIVITIELPELAVDHIEMLIAEVSRYLIDIFLVLEDRDHREQIASSQLRHGNPSAPASIHAVKYPSDHLDRMKIRRLTSLNINFVALILPPRYWMYKLYDKCKIRVNTEASLTEKKERKNSTVKWSI